MIFKTMCQIFNLDVIKIFDIEVNIPRTLYISLTYVLTEKKCKRRWRIYTILPQVINSLADDSEPLPTVITGDGYITGYG